MNYRYNKDSLKENLTIEEVYNFVSELGGEPIMGSNFFTARTICHNSLKDIDDSSHKLYYYDNTHLFHCYTGCGDSSFDIFDLVLKINKNNGNINFSLQQAIDYVARYFNISLEESFSFEDNIETTEDWKIINNFKKNKERKSQPIDTKDTTIYDEKILNHLPQPHILSWEKEGIDYSAIKFSNIRYDPVNESVIIPHYDINNRLIGIRERTLIKEKEVYGKYRPATFQNKMYNHALGFHLYNLNNSKTNIKKYRKAIIYEGEKNCLKHYSYFGVNNDISVACCGSNLSKFQVQLLLSLDIKEMIIAFDKQFQTIGDDEWRQWTKKLKILYDKYNGYVKISYLFDKEDILQYKSSPIDEGEEKFLYLFTNRITIE